MTTNTHRGQGGDRRHSGRTRLMTRFAFVSSLAGVSFVASAVPARAELVYFNTGRTMSVKGHRVDGDSVVLALRTGGEIVMESSTIARFAPDEVPYPEPEAEKPAVV